MLHHGLICRNIWAPRVKVDSKVISVKIQLSPDPKDQEDVDNNDYSDCKVDYSAMKYDAVVMRFIHLDQQTSLKKLLWHQDNLQTTVGIQ